MDSSGTFTGRPRRRSTHARVRGADRVARLLITIGGIGTIVAVLLVGVFLLAVALPLFRAAVARPAGSFAAAATAPAALGIDESGAVAWFVEPAGDGGEQARSGGVSVVGVADGAPLFTESAVEAGVAGATAIRVLPGTLQAAVGFADGSFRSGRLGLESSFVDVADLAADAPRPESGGAVPWNGAALVRGANERYARVTFVAEFGAASPETDAPVIDIDLTSLEGGPLVAALDGAGLVRVAATTSRRNLLTDEVVSESIGTTIEPPPGFTPRFVRLSELGDQLFLFAADGRGRRYVIRDVEAPVEMESFTAAPAEAGVALVERLFGGSALVVVDGRGTIRELFTARVADTAAADGLTTVVARTFAAGGAPGGDEPAVTAIAASPRSRLFATADAAGDVRLLHATTGATVLRLPPAPGGATGAAVRLCIAPREDHLLVAGDRGMTAYALAVGHPEVSPRTLLRPVWYESYPGPVHAWETTGHEAFEPKFGLLPLIFGTFKATLYAMLFATPVAILAAVYASQFMHARWRARIKPTIELMAGLPSVVLGFVAGLVFAPLLERAVVPAVTALFVVPLSLLTCAHLWQFVPAGWRNRLAAWRFVFVAVVAIPAGLAASRLAAPVVERVLFQGDFRGWLDGRGGSGFGGWVLATVPLAAVAVTAVCGRYVGPWLRRSSQGWSDRRAAVVSCAVFACGVLATAGLAVAAAMFCDALRIDTRGGLFGTYVQRNALVVGLGMSFAIIPLIFTIADDALTSVPEHLRSASLGAGATPWQTAVRVIVPAAASGLFSAVMIGLGRAVGETMIVLMAAGNTPIMDWNLFNGFQTLSAAIATELPEAARGSAHYRVLFLAALVLFALTFVVNTAAELIRQRFRRRSHEL